jgi:hypothetical protein
MVTEPAAVGNAVLDGLPPVDDEPPAGVEVVAPPPPAELPLLPQAARASAAATATGAR